MSKTELDTGKVETLLKYAGSIVDKHATVSAETGADFNIFEIANISTKEVAICRVIAELLSPEGRHRQGGLYLSLFLRDCLNLNITEDEAAKAKVHREYGTANGRRIDIVIEVGNRFIPIEAKIYADDQWRQCKDYYDFAKRQVKGVVQVVYLTLDGHIPEEYSTEGIDPEKDLMLISFHIKAFTRPSIKNR